MSGDTFGNVVTSWPVWRTVTIGRYNSATMLEATDNRVTNMGHYILKKISFAGGLEELKLVRASGRELCGDRYATTCEIFAAAEARGWRKCPAEVGPALRKQYVNQPEGEWVHIAMEPILGPYSGLHLFSVGRNHRGRWLDALNAAPSVEWNPEDVWVFLDL